MHFREWNVLYFYSNYTEICSLGSNWDLVSIGTGNGLTLSRRQAITWTNDDPVNWRIHIGEDELMMIDARGFNIEIIGLAIWKAESIQRLLN